MNPLNMTRQHLMKTVSRSRLLSSRLGSLILLFQRSPVVQILFPEARLLGGAGLADVTGWTIATFVGLGGYDTVAGATTISQLAPSAGATTVPAAVGSNLSFVFQLLNYSDTPGSWKVTGLPAGLNHANAKNSTVDSVSGIPATAGNFNVSITAYSSGNYSGDSFSKSFTLNIGSAVIATHPASVLIASGDTATLTVTGNGGGLTYQWYRGNSGNTGNPLNGKTSASLTTPSLTTATDYWVRVTRGNGVTADSDTATVSIGNPPTITNQPDPVTTNPGESANLSINATGTSLSFQWYRGNSGVTSNPISGATSRNFTTPPLTNTTGYWVRVSNSLGKDDSNTAVVSVRIPPEITSHPASVTIDSGGTTTLGVTASGTTPSFQWYLGETGDTSNPVDGATTGTLTTPLLTNITRYWVRVSNPAGTSDSATAVISINTPPLITGEPLSLLVSEGGSVTFTVTASGTSPSFQWYEGTSGDTTLPIPEATQRTYTTPPLFLTKSYWVRVSNGSGSDDSVTATATVQSVPVFTTPPASVSILLGNTATFTCAATGGSLTFQWYLGESGDTSQTIDGETGSSFTSANLTTTTHFWVRATNAGGHTDSSTATATITIAPAISDEPDSVTIHSGMTANLTVAFSGSSSDFQWYLGESGDTGNPLADATSATFTTPSLTTSSSYWVRATNIAGSADSATAVVTVITPPLFTLAPVSLTINRNGSTTLVVAASGTAPTFQWYAGKTGVVTNPIDGANASSFTTPPLTATASYWVRATNAAGSADSATATISLRLPPAITKQPAALTIRKGKKAALRVIASGSSPVYQWFKGISGNTKFPVAGARSATFTTPSLKLTTSYWVRVSNAAGTVNSKTVTVTVKKAAPPSRNAIVPPSPPSSYEIWSRACFGNTPWSGLSSATDDPDGDGISNGQEYIFGLDPLASGPVPAPAIRSESDSLSLSFTARAASGTGYEGLARFYTLEYAASPDAAVWSEIPGFSGISGNDRLIRWSVPAGETQMFYRLKITLAPLR
jgi:Ig-like domain CHU_C associated